MARYTDLKDFPNKTKAQNAIKERVAKTIYNALKNEFGNEFVAYINKEIFITENSIRVPKGTIVADVGDVTDDGCEVGACVEVSVTSKRWWSAARKNGSAQIGITLDDYLDELDKEG